MGKRSYLDHIYQVPVPEYNFSLLFVVTIQGHRRSGSATLGVYFLAVCGLWYQGRTYGEVDYFRGPGTGSTLSPLLLTGWIPNVPDQHWSIAPQGPTLRPHTVHASPTDLRSL